MSGSTPRRARRAPSNVTPIAKARDYPPELISEHVEQLRKRGVAPTVARARGYRTVTTRPASAKLGFGRNLPLPALVFPLRDAAGRVVGVQARPNVPRLDENGKPRKYEIPFKQRNVVDVPLPCRAAIDDPSVPLVVTEGTLKADAGASHGLCCVSINGVYGFRGTNAKGGKTLLSDWYEIALNDRDVYLAFDSDVTTKPEVARALRELAGVLEKRGARVHIILFPLGPKGEKTGLDDYLARGGTADGVLALATDELPAEVRPVEDHETDTGLARRFVARFGDEVRHCAALGGWHVYDGGRWRRSDRGDVEQRLHIVVQSLWEALADPTLSTHRKKALARFAAVSEGAYHLHAALSVAATDPRVIVPVSAFDADPWLFNCANGTLNLRDQDRALPIRSALRKLRRDHAPGDLLRLQSPVAFDPTATAPKFDAFLRRIFGGKRDVIAFVQRFVGYALTGSTGAQQFYLWHGDGANGKSQLITILRRVLGDYAVAADYDTFLLSNRDVRSARPDLVRLVGARFVSAVETKHVRHLDEGLLKQVTGGDPIVCRTLYREPVTFTPQLKLILCANDKPTITGRDHAIWRRVVFLPFTETIPEAERIDNFAETVIAPTELPGVLRWAVEGCLAWQREGLGAPPTIAAATAEYKSLQDTLAPFFEDHCVEGPTHAVRSEAIYDAYNDWARLSGHRPMSMKSFGEELRRRGYVRVKVDGDRGWRGVAVRKLITEA